MPKYDYRCDQNGRTIEVSHPMSQAIHTWGELCELSGLDTGDTPKNSPVHKIISGGFVATGPSVKAGPHSCATPSCCSGGICGLDS